MERIRKNSFELLSVKNSYETIRQRLETLDADGGTNICDALAHSVLLTSMVDKSNHKIGSHGFYLFKNFFVLKGKKLVSYIVHRWLCLRFG